MVIEAEQFYALIASLSLRQTQLAAPKAWITDATATASTSNGLRQAERGIASISDQAYSIPKYFWLSTSAFICDVNSQIRAAEDSTRVERKDCGTARWEKKARAHPGQKQCSVADLAIMRNRICRQHVCGNQSLASWRKISDNHDHDDRENWPFLVDMPMIPFFLGAGTAGEKESKPGKLFGTRQTQAFGRQERSFAKLFAVAGGGDDCACCRCLRNSPPPAKHTDSGAYIFMSPPRDFV